MTNLMVSNEWFAVAGGALQGGYAEIGSKVDGSTTSGGCMRWMPTAA